MAAKRTRQHKEFFTTLSAASFMALMTIREDFKNCRDLLTLVSQCTSSLAAESKEFLEKTADRENANAAVKTTSKSRE